MRKLVRGTPGRAAAEGQKEQARTWETQGATLSPSLCFTAERGATLL